MTDLLRDLLAPGGVVVVVAGIVAALVKKFPPRATTLAQELAQVKEEAARDRSAAAQHRADVGHDMRLLSDYVHDLREHIASGKPPPPPDWPQGMRL